MKESLIRTTLDNITVVMVALPGFAAFFNERENMQSNSRTDSKSGSRTHENLYFQKVDLVHPHPPEKSFSGTHTSPYNPPTNPVGGTPEKRSSSALVRKYFDRSQDHLKPTNVSYSEDRSGLSGFAKTQSFQ